MAYKAPRRTCPKCGVGMPTLQLEGVQVELCPRCGGMWFDAGELHRAAGLRFDDGVSAQALAGARRTDFRCPACAALLSERELGARSRLMVDQCPRCAGLFLDRDEFSRVKEFFRSAGAPSQPTPRPSDVPAEPEPAIDEDNGLLELFQCLTNLPVELDSPQTLFPPVVVGLLAANAVVLVLAYVFGFEDWLYTLALVPADVVVGRHLYTLLTHMFMHGGVIHLLGNMYFLYIMGDNVEGRFGHVRFLGFYLLCGLVAGLAQIAGDPASTLPAVGASGAIAGVMGAYMVLFPRNRLLMRGWLRGWMGWSMRTYRWEVPAVAFLAFWIILQLIYGAIGAPGVGWWAHVGGFACGAVIALAVRLASAQHGDTEGTKDTENGKTS